MANQNEMDDLFGGSLDTKMDFLNEKKAVNADGIYRIDLKNLKDKKKGYRSVIRFLPNLMKEGGVGQSAIEKITHYVNIKNDKDLSGFYDSAKNFGEKCPLTDLFYTLTNSKNAILQEKAKCLNYSKKYYSYVLIIEDENQPELVGKIMIFQYGKTIKDKILSEQNGEISGERCNVFDLAKGKDFVLIVKEIQTGDETYPDYKHSMFKGETSSLPLYNAEKGTFRNVPLDANGQVDKKAQGVVRDFLMNREHDLEDFAAKRLTEEQQSKVSQITSILTGKISSGYNAQSKESAPSSDDFEFEDSFDTGSSSKKTEDENDDDFFADFK